MYTSGELAVLVGKSKYGITINDSADDIEFESNVVYLPHSCGYWVIGGVEQMRSLICDLEAAITAIALPQPRENNADL